MTIIGPGKRPQTSAARPPARAVIDWTRRAFHERHQALDGTEAACPMFQSPTVALPRAPRHGGDGLDRLVRRASAFYWTDAHRSATILARD
ncbi:MAG: hypothetical protein ACREEZ_08930 [Stellaceae bacterium]